MPHALLAPPIHLCLIHPLGDRAALSVLDTALALRDDLQALDVSVTLARQRLRADAVNIVIGIEHGFDADAARGHCCLLLNRAPLRDGGGRLPAAALRQLQRFPVVDVDPLSLAVLRAGTPSHAPATATWLPGPQRPPAPPGLPLAERPIPLLMSGAPTARQAALLAGMAQAGIAVARLDQALAGPELAAMQAQARAVLCLLPDDDAPPDLLAMALALRQGTPVLAERPGNGQLPDAPPASAVMWFEPTGDGLAAALKGGAEGAAFAAAGAACLEAFAHTAPTEPARAVWTLAQALWAEHTAAGLTPPLPDRLCVLSPGQSRRPGWWHVAARPSGAIDEVLDLRQPLTPEGVAYSGHWAVVDAGAWSPDDQMLPVNLLSLLAEGGRAILRCPVSALAGSAAGGDARAAAVSTALAPWTRQFWRSGLFSHRFHLEHLGPLDEAGAPVALRDAHQLRLVLVRRETSYQERSQARAMRDDFGLAELAAAAIA